MRPSWLFLSLSLHGAVLGTAAVAVHRGTQRTPKRPPHVELQSSAASALAAAAEAPAVEPPPVVGEASDAVVEFGDLPPEPLQAPAAVPEAGWPVPAVPLARYGRRALVLRPSVQPAPEPAPAVVEAVGPAEAPPEAIPPVVAEPSAYVAARQRADNAAPEYPASERAAGHEGTVVVAARIDAQGLVVEASLAEPSSHPGLNRAALRAVRAWRFEPAMQDGRPVEGRLDVPVVFRLQDG